MLIPILFPCLNYLFDLTCCHYFFAEIVKIIMMDLGRFIASDCALGLLLEILVDYIV